MTNLEMKMTRADKAETLARIANTLSYGPLTTGIVAMGLTVACFMLKLLENEAHLPLLGFCLIACIALIIATDGLSAWLTRFVNNKEKDEATTAPQPMEAEDAVCLERHVA